ncbi:MAG: hypothetical protein FWB71_06640, partial [Defluviitaleaceae bacterium]|nr:hypothetical protein [Defluviitaleaceae bacterium]
MILSLMACGGRDDFANSSIHWLDGQWVQNSGLRARYADYPTRLEFDGGTYAFVLTNYWAVASPGVAPRG